MGAAPAVVVHYSGTAHSGLVVLGGRFRTVLFEPASAVPVVRLDLALAVVWPVGFVSWGTLFGNAPSPYNHSTQPGTCRHEGDFSNPLLSGLTWPLGLPLSLPG